MRYSAPPESGLGEEHVLAVVAELLLVTAARVVRDHPVDITGEHVLPQRLDVGSGADRRVDLGTHRGVVDVGEEVRGG